MKKVIFVVLAVVVVCTLSACGSMSEQKTVHLRYSPVSQVSEAPTAPIPTKK